MGIGSYRVRARLTPRAVVIALSLGAVVAFMPATRAQQARADAEERTRLLDVQRNAVARLQDAGHVGAPADQVRRPPPGGARGASRFRGATARQNLKIPCMGATHRRWVRPLRTSRLLKMAPLSR